jgi:hypothetical protein
MALVILEIKIMEIKLVTTFDEYGFSEGYGYGYSDGSGSSNGYGSGYGWL